MVVYPKIEPRLLDVGLGGFDRCGGGEKLSGGVVELALAQRLPCGQRFDPGEVVARDLQPRLLFGELALRRIELGLERLGVLQEHDLPGLDEAAFGIDALVEEAVDARHDLHLARALRLADELEADRRVARRHLHHRHFDGGTFLGFLFFLLAPCYQGSGEEQGEPQAGPPHVARNNVGITKSSRSGFDRKRSKRAIIVERHDGSRPAPARLRPSRHLKTALL